MTSAGPSSSSRCSAVSSAGWAACAGMTPEGTDVPPDDRPIPPDDRKSPTQGQARRPPDDRPNTADGVADVSTARLRRSVLAVPGSNPRMMEKAAASAADEVFLDLEDACAPLEKPAARGKVVEALRTHDWHGKTRVVRINQVTSQFAFDDLREVVTGAGDVLDCIMVPKVRNAGDVAFVDRALLQLEQSLGLEIGRIGIEAQIEDAEGLMRADEIAFSSKRLETLTYGPGRLLRVDAAAIALGAQRLQLPGRHLSLRALQARGGGARRGDPGRSTVHTSPSTTSTDTARPRRAPRRSATTGNGSLHPVQIEPANEAFTPAQADFDKAARMLEAYRQRNRGRSARGGHARRRDDRRGVAKDRRCSSTHAVSPPG